MKDIRSRAIAAIFAFFLCSLLGHQVKADPVSPNNVYACTHAAIWTSNSTALVTSATAKQIYVCGYACIGGTAAATCQIGYATTATSCGSLTAVTPVFSAATGVAVIDHPDFYSGLLPAPTGNDLCGTTTGTGAALIVYWTQF